MRGFYIGTAMAFALASISSAGLAQGPDLKGNDAPGKAEGPAAPSTPGRAQQAPQQPAPGRTEGERAPEAPKGAQVRPDGAKQGEKAPGRAAKEQDRDQPRRTDEPSRQPKAAQQPRTEDRKAAEQPRKEDRKAAEQPRKDDRKSSEGPARTDQQNGAQEKSTQGRPSEKQAAPAPQGSRVRVTEEQRSNVRERLLKSRVDKVAKSRVNISLTIGAAVPRGVRIYPLAATIIEVAPEYRGYSYIVFEDDTIVIVDQRTYVIVDVIQTSGARAERPQQRGHLALSREQMRFVFESVPKDRQADVRVRLALGAEVPRDVELFAFRDDVIGRIPELRSFRFIVTGGDVAIVDPNDRSVALVITE